MKTAKSREKMQAAGLLLECGCLQLSPERPFSYASGLVGPIYCDNRLVLSYPQNREALVLELKKLCHSRGLQELTVAGVASAGVPHAAILAHELKRPMLYVRSKKKEHGRQNRIEGQLVKGQEVLVVEDLVNQGGSVADAIEALRDEGAVVKHVVCLVSYQLPTAIERLSALDVELHYLCDFDSILDEAVSRQQISTDQVESLRRWQKNPKNWRP